MERSLQAFVWRHSWRAQIVLLALTCLSFPVLYASLEIPKLIVNEAINGTDFPRPLFGAELGQIPYLLALCGVFLLLIVVLNGFKWLINTGIGMTGERLLRRLRFTLFERVMRFPLQRFRSLRTGETVQSIMGEVEPLGGFVGELIVTPVFQGGMLAVYVGFIFVQDVWLGLAAVALYPVQAYVIPLMQRRIVRLNKARAANARELADRIGESIANIADIRQNDAARWHLAQVSNRLHANTQIRQALFRRKFTIKFINNFLNQLTPFFFYSVGGYLVIRGQLDFGSLVAVLAAYKDLAGPWKALLGFFQRWSDFRSRFQFLIEDFESDALLAPDRLYREDAPALSGDLTVERVTAGAGTEALTIPALRLTPGSSLAVIGGASGGRETALRLIAGVEPPAEGRVLIGGTDLAGATLAQIGAALAHVGPHPGTIRGTVRENALYALMRRMPALSGADPETVARLSEARATGNLASDPGANWIDHAAAGASDDADLDERLIAMVEAVGLSESLYSVALGRRLPQLQIERWGGPLLALRDRFARDVASVEDLVELWQPDRFNANAPLLANLLFALPLGAEDPLRAPQTAVLLRAAGAEALLEAIGLDIARELDALGEAVERDSAILDRLGGFDRQDIAEAAALVAAVDRRGRPGRGERPRLARLAAGFVEMRDQFDVLDAVRKAEVLAVRARARRLIAGRPDFIAFDDPRYNPMRTVLENILHAQRRHDRRSEWHRLDALLETAIREAGLWRHLVRIGLDAPLSEAGLSQPALRRLALVRAVLKHPAFLILDGIAEGAGAEDRALRDWVRATLPECCIVYGAASEAAAAGADRTAEIGRDGVMRPG